MSSAPMTTIIPSDLSTRDAYRLLTSIVAPRPIAWISTMGIDGSLNLAPYSFFNAVTGQPPIVMFSAGQRAGKVKDTLRNVQETGEFVVNVVNEALAEPMNLSSGDWGYGESEFDITGVATAPSIDVRPPRVANAPVSMEARVTQIIPVEGSTSTLVLGQIIRYHIREDLLRPNGLVDSLAMQTVSRLGGDEYSTIGRVFELARPVVQPK